MGLVLQRTGNNLTNAGPPTDFTRC